MDTRTFQELSKRVTQLELALATPGLERIPIFEQLHLLQTQLGEIYELHEELSTLNTILSQLKVEEEDPTEDPLVEGDYVEAEHSGNLDNSQKVGHSEVESSDDIDIPAKRQLIALKQPQIRLALSHSSELAAMDLRVNYIQYSKDKTHNYNSDKREILRRREQLKYLTNKHHKVLLKNMIVFERYVDLIQRENKFWLNSQDQLGRLEVEVRKFESVAKEESRY